MNSLVISCETSFLTSDPRLTPFVADTVLYEEDRICPEREYILNNKDEHLKITIKVLARMRLVPTAIMQICALIIISALLLQYMHVLILAQALKHKKEIIPPC